MSRQERIRRENVQSSKLIPGKCYECQADIPKNVQVCDGCAAKYLEVEQERENAVDEEFEKFKLEEQAAFQAAVDRRYEEKLARQYEMKCLSPEERGQTPDLFDIRHHPNPPKSMIDFFDHDQ